MVMLQKKDCGCHQMPEQNRLAIQEEMASHWDRLADISAALKTLTGVCTRLLARVEETSGMPKGKALPIVQASPTQNTLYPSAAIAINGTAQGFLLCGPGNVSLYINDPDIISGKALIATIPSNGTPIFLPFWHKAKVNDTFSVATDSNAGTLLSMTTWVEPVALTGSQMFQLAR